MRICVVGGGWAGLAAAVEATNRGHQVILLEMAPQLGGRAREVQFKDMALDNGQHILIGAYSQTLALMRLVGIDINAVLLRMPLHLTYPNGTGLQLGAGAPALEFARAVLRCSSWQWQHKLSLLYTASRWRLRKFQCDSALTVHQLIEHLPTVIREELLEPLCIAALNTPPVKASASVFLQIFSDALFSGPGSADLLFPRCRLSALWPEPALQWLRAAGAAVELSHRVEQLERTASGWDIGGIVADAVVLACSAVEAQRLVAPLNPAWAQLARQLTYEPIMTIYMRSKGTRLPQAMLALHSNAHSPAQFVFDLGILGGPDSVLAFVISGASHWVKLGAAAAMAATLEQGTHALANHLASPLEAMHIATEKRATFLCTPNLQRPTSHVLDRLMAAGDYVAGPYPATLEGAMRSGVAAVASVTNR